MSNTSTPEPDGCPHGIIRGIGCWKCERAELNKALTAALARIAELEGETDSKDRVINSLQSDYSNLLKEDAKSHQEIKSLTRQLSEKDSKITELEKDNDDKEAAYQNVSGHVQRLQDERNELRIRDEQWKTKFEQTHLTWAADGVRRDELEAELRRQLFAAQAQLASAREDSARLDWLLEFITQNGANGIAKMQWTIKDDEGEIVNDGDTIQEDRLEAHFDRSAIDSARGVTSPPTVAETGEKDAWQDIATAPKDGNWFLQLIIGEYKPGVPFVPMVVKYEMGTLIDPAKRRVPFADLWLPIPPPPQGKEQE